MPVVNVVLKVPPKQSRYLPYAIIVNQDTIHRLQSHEPSTPLPKGAILAAIQQAITQTLNATQGHTRNYPTSYFNKLLLRL